MVYITQGKKARIAHSTQKNEAYGNETKKELTKLQKSVSYKEWQQQESTGEKMDKSSKKNKKHYQINDEEYDEEDWDNQL